MLIRLLFPLNIVQFLGTTFWLKPWLKSISFGSNFFRLAKVLDTTNSEPGKALKIIHLFKHMFWVFKKTSHQVSSFEYPQHLFGNRLGNKKINFEFCSLL